MTQSLFSLRASTLKQAVKKNFLSSFPGLLTALIDKHLDSSVPTEFGHLRQEKQHLQSTSSSPTTAELDAVFPPSKQIKLTMSFLR